jgi:hypothetical protein
VMAADAILEIDESTSQDAVDKKENLKDKS